MGTSSRLSQTFDFFGRIGDKMKLPDDDNAAVAQVLTDYYRAFSTLDAQAVLPYFHEPSQLISPAGVAVRRKTDGQELERTGVVYLLQRTSAGWQFATVAIHDAEDALRPE
jgi:hypothetical protein